MSLKRIPLDENPDAIRHPLRPDWGNDEAVEQARPALERITRIVAGIVDRQARERADSEEKASA